MSDQYLRACILTVGDKHGEGLDLSALRITFSITSADAQTPKTAIIRVYNASADTAARVHREFSQVVLQAGYEGMAAVIFSGQIKQVVIGRENGTDNYVEIIAADGDVAYNQATLNQSLAAGWTPTELRKACLDAMAPYGVTAGQMAPLPDIKAPRGRSLYGFARDYLRELAQEHGMTWSIVLGQLQMLPIEGTLGCVTIELTSETGLIGMPKQTIDGFMVKCLINPIIKPGMRIRLKNSSIQEARISTNTLYTDTRPEYDQGGDYKVWAMSINGDTRGNPWYMDLVCAAVKGRPPMTSSFVNSMGVYGS